MKILTSSEKRLILEIDVLKSEISVLKQEQSIKENKILQGLSELYSKGDYVDKSLIAQICDEVLDRSGALLGEVRNGYNEKRQKTTRN